MIEDTLYKPETIFFIAKDFFENAHRAAAKLPKQNQNILTFYKLSFPATCFSFSLELALKGLLLNCGRKESGHNLKHLFNILSPQLHEKIYSHIKTHDKFQHLISIILKKGNIDDYRNGIRRESINRLKKWFSQCWNHIINHSLISDIYMNLENKKKN